MESFRVQFALMPAALAVALLSSSASARAGYVTLATLVDHESGRSLLHLPISPLTEFDSSFGTSDLSEASQQFPNENDPQLPIGPISPSRKPPYGAYTFAYDSGSTSSSSSAPSSAPSSYAAGFSPGTQIPPLELSSLLPPPKGAADSFHVASFLFRPPRAA